MKKPQTNKRWRRSLRTMPAEGVFDVLVLVRGVFKHMPNHPRDPWVIRADTGRMYVPIAWRPAARKRKAAKK